MVMKTTITLILGLLFQLAQVLPGAVVAMPCVPVAESCECCEGPDSCPCAENEEPSQQPAPLAPDLGGGVKLPASKADDSRISVEFLLETHPSTHAVACPLQGPPNGYQGVRLSVAFCSFVI